MAYPSSIDAPDTTQQGTTSLSSEDHALQHRTVAAGLIAVENVLGTTGGTSVLKDFSAGQFPVRVNSGGTVLQTLTGGTLTNSVIINPTGDITSLTGLIMINPVVTVPSGWLECNGTAISRTTYSSLFSILSTTYGTGNGTSTFNIPDFRGAFLRGYGGSSGGIGTIQNDAFQGHYHDVRNYPQGGANGIAAVSGGVDDSNYGFSDITQASVATFTAGAPYADGTNGTPRTASETRPTNFAIKYIIKT